MANGGGTDNRDDRGTERLLWDCRTVGLAISERPPADERLRDEVGDDLADLLLAGLTAGAPAQGDAPPAEPGRAA